MAKLSARGRTEIWRYSIETDIPGVTEPYEPIWRKTVYARMSDGNLLMKRIAKWSGGHRHDYGWKNEGKRTAEEFQKIQDRAERSGWKREI